MGQAHLHEEVNPSLNNLDGRLRADCRPVAGRPGSWFGRPTQLSERGVVGSGRQRLPAAGGASPVELPERGVVGSGRQRVQAAGLAGTAQLRRRTVLESDHQCLPAARPVLEPALRPARPPRWWLRVRSGHSPRCTHEPGRQCGSASGSPGRIQTSRLSTRYPARRTHGFRRCVHRVSVRCMSIEYRIPWDDEEFDRDSAIALFTAFASTEKSLHARSGGHYPVPDDERDSSARFFTRNVGRLGAN